MKNIFTGGLCIILFICGAISQDTDRKIQFPDVEGYLTLKCDFHIHTVFSDGFVWPNIRVDEAVRDGLDAIAITDHIEYQPHKADIPHPDRNRSYELARDFALPFDLLVIPGVEITRQMPPGHANALFITDANKLNIPDSLMAYREARRQGAFIFWNHPNWLPQQNDGLPVLSSFHQMLIDEDLLHGMEVVNDITYTEEGLQMALDNDLTVIGTSDIHGLVDWQFRISEGGHRPICLVLSRERSLDGIKEALCDGRTIAWFDNLLIGKASHVTALIYACLSAKGSGFIGPSSVFQVDITNESDALFILQNRSNYTFYKNSEVITILPHSTKKLEILTRDGHEVREIEFEVLNAVTGFRIHPVITLKVD